MTPDEVRALIGQYLNEANAENAVGGHRGLVLVWASIIDDVLERMLKSYFVPINREQRDELFGPMGPVGEFSNRIKMAFALGLIKRDEMDCIDELRRIRNKFAHRLGVSLNDPDLAVASSTFGNRLTGDNGRGDPTLKFTAGCGSLLMILVNRLSRITTTPGVPDDRNLPDRAYGAPQSNE